MTVTTEATVIAIGIVMAFFLTGGAMFAAANTMYAAVASRGREIGTLRALGFRRRTIVTAFLAEYAPPAMDDAVRAELTDCVERRRSEGGIDTDF